MSEYALRRCTEWEEWDRFLDDSPQTNIFARSAVLAAMPKRPDLWLLERDGSPAAGAILFPENGECRTAQQPRTWYQGVFYRTSDAPVHSEVRRHLEISESLLNSLAQNYNSLSFCVHPTVMDIRSFSWLNYRCPDKGRLVAAPQYTGIIDLTGFEEFDEYLITIRASRREDLKKALRLDVNALESRDVAAYGALELSNVFERNDPSARTNVEFLQKVASILLDDERCRLLLATDSSGKPIAGVMFLRDGETAYYYASAVDAEWRRSGVTTFLLLESIRRAWQSGVRRIDMLGINSPQRGDFKTSFNAKPSLYFNFTWKES